MLFYLFNQKIHNMLPTANQTFSSAEKRVRPRFGNQLHLHANPLLEVQDICEEM